jgi:DNA-binding transcriptional MerR regulator
MVDDSGIIVAAFGEEQVERLTGLSKSQLRYWDRTGFFVPSYAEEDRRLPYSRIYSFRDILALRTLSLLRNQNNVPLQHLRKVADKLRHLKDDLWTKTQLYVHGRKVVFEEPGTGQRQEPVSQQYVMGIPLKKIWTDTRRDVEALRRRPEEKVGHVERSRSVNRNAWVVGGTRIPTGAIRRFNEAGYSTDQILKEYPDLTPADVKAALAHEAQLTAA